MSKAPKRAASVPAVAADPTLPPGTVKLADGIANLLANLGSVNPGISGNFYAAMALDDSQLEAAYTSSTWFAKIVDIPAEDATREWRTWSADQADSLAIFETEKRLSAAHVVREALVYARLYGGSVIVPVGLPGDGAEPFDVRRLPKNALQALVAVPKPMVTAAPNMITDPLNPYFGRPEKYEIGGVTFHPSRIIHFNGKRRPSFLTSRDPWGFSVYVSLMDALRQSEMAPSVVAQLMQESKLDVIRIEDFMAQIADPEFEKLFMKRWQLVMQGKSIANATILDKNDEWEQKQISFAGLPEVITTFLTILAGACDIPVTRLLGTSAKGLNATGEGDLRNYYDNVRARQRLDLTPTLRPLDNMLLWSALGRDPGSISHDWVPLYQMSAKEIADIEKAYAETNASLVNAGNVDPVALGKAMEQRMIESGAWPGFEQAREESEWSLDIPDVTPDPTLPATPDNSDPALPARAVVRDASRAFNFADATPRSLYVRRDVVNRDEITAWAKSQGFETVLDDLHVTIIHSRTPVDWMVTGDPWTETVEVPAGGARLVDVFNGGAQVLLFASSSLKWRHKDFLDAGARSDYPEFQPHVTISYKAPRALPGTIVPYRGRIILGPEIFEEVREDWKSTVTES